MNVSRRIALLAAGIGILAVCPAQVHLTVPHGSWTPLLALADQDSAKTARPGQEFDEEPVLIKRTPPVYPASALKDSTEGTVYLRVAVDKDGSVGKIVVEKGARKDLDEAAIACLKEWKFTPARLKGAAVQTTVVVPFRFRLTKEPVGSKAK